MPERRAVSAVSPAFGAQQRRPGRASTATGTPSTTSNLPPSPETATFDRRVSITSVTYAVSMSMAGGLAGVTVSQLRTSAGRKSRMVSST